MHAGISVKANGDELQGQEEAAYKYIFIPIYVCNHYHELFANIAAMKFASAVTKLLLSHFKSSALQLGVESTRQKSHITDIYYI